jgi:hypothetical protein
VSEREMLSDELVEAMENLPQYPRLIAERAAKEARTDLAARIEARVQALRADTTDTSGGTFFWGSRAGYNSALDDVLAALREEAAK